MLPKRSVVLNFKELKDFKVFKALKELEENLQILFNVRMENHYLYLP